MKQTKTEKSDIKIPNINCDNLDLAKSKVDMKKNEKNKFKEERIENELELLINKTRNFNKGLEKMLKNISDSSDLHQQKQNNNQ